MSLFSLKLVRFNDIFFLFFSDSVIDESIQRVFFITFFYNKLNRLTKRSSFVNVTSLKMNNQRDSIPGIRFIIIILFQLKKSHAPF